MDKEKFLKITRYIGEKISQTGFENKTYAVGGSVRDFVMGNEIKDIDLVVELPNGGICLAQYFEQIGLTKGSVVVYPTYGTAMFHLKEFPDDEIEVVQTRGEQYHEETRNPITCYASILEDAFRRDLTINALYYNLTTGKIEDYTQKGLADIKNHIIRVTNNNPDIVFNDDPLRILRVIRFATRFDWEIEENTRLSMIKNRDRLSIITQERITDEFSKILTCKYPEKGLEMVDDVVGLENLIDIFNVDYSCLRKDPVFETILNVLMFTSNNLDVRLAALLHLFNDECVCSTLKNMKYSNKMVESVLTLIDSRLFDGFMCEYDNYYNRKPDKMNKEISKMQHVLGSKEMFWKYIDLHSAICDANDKDTDFVDVLLDRVNIDKIDMFDYNLPVNGNDIMEVLGIEPSREVEVAKNLLLDLAYANNNITRDECISWLNENKNFIKFKANI